MTYRLFLIPALLCVAACDEEPVHYSAPVGMSMTAASGDVDDGLILEEKNINTESANPYAAFIADARDALGGVDPGAIDVEDVTITIEASSTGVTSFDEIFVGPVEVSFVMNSSDNSYPVALVDDDGATIQFEAPATDHEDWQSLIGGNFKVVLEGDAAPGFEARDANADLAVTISFGAYE